MSEQLTPEEQELEDNFNEFAKKADKNTSDEDQDDDVGSNEQDDDQGDQGDELPNKQDDNAGDQELDAKEVYEKKIRDWEHKYNSDIGRVNSYQRKIQEQQEQLDKFAANSAGDNPNNSGMSDGEWEALKEDYPDIAKAFDSRLDAIKNQNNSELDKIRSQLQPLEERQQEQYHGIQMQQLNAAHPDWQEIVNTAEYGAWLNNQPQEVQSFTQSMEADKNIYLLNAFKGATQQPAQENANPLLQKRQKQLQQAQTIQNRSSVNKREALSSDDGDAAFEFYAKKKDSRRI